MINREDMLELTRRMTPALLFRLWSIWQRNMECL